MPKHCWNYHWGYICGDYWDTSDGNVLCGELGFQSGGLLALATPSDCINLLGSFVGSSFTLARISTTYQTLNRSSPFPVRYSCNGREKKLSECSQSFGSCSRILSQLKCTGWSYCYCTYDTSRKNAPFACTTP